MDELLSRFPAAMFIGMKPDGHNNDGIWWEIKGMEIPCIGLYQKLNEMMCEHFNPCRCKECEDDKD
jgi:hypothetical protein